MLELSGTWGDGRWAINNVFSVIKVACPHERFTSDGANQPSNFYCGAHSLWPVNKGPKHIASQPPQEVLHCNHGGTYQRSRGYLNAITWRFSLLVVARELPP